jgi:hypothetical protein
MTARSLHRVAVALVCIVLSFAVVVGAARAGSRYFYCEAMGFMTYDPCAAENARRADDVTTAESPQPDCCDVVHFAPLPDSTRASTPTVAASPFVAVVAAIHTIEPTLLGVRRSDDSARHRWRLSPRPPRETRAKLMVFLT